jgi:GT2 family glycosyltransferase
MPTRDDDPRVLALALDAVIRERLEHPAVVVDMSREDAVRQVVEARAPSVRYVPYRESQGVSDSRNRLVELVETRYLLFLDADAVPRPRWALAMRESFDQGDNVAVVGARCLPVWPGKVPFLFESTPAQDMLGMFDLGEEPRDVPRIMGTSYAIDRERLPAGSPFSPEIGRRPGSFLAGEEVDFCLRVKATGWDISYEPGAVVDHYVRPERATWSWMLRRMFVAGQESARWSMRLEDLPRRQTVRDRLFLGLVAPWFLAGRLKARR